MVKAHDKLIATAAKQTLIPLGFQRKGRSRIWLKDHSWWLVIVEFQPSGWSSGSCLNVSAHWLWSEQGFTSFDYGGRVHGFIQYESDQQFEPEAMRLADIAAKEASRLEHLFVSLSAAADVLAEAERARPQQGEGSWPAYNAGVAMGICGRMEEAEQLFHSIRDNRVRSAVSRILPYVRDAVGLRHAARDIIGAQRVALGLAHQHELFIP